MYDYIIALGSNKGDRLEHLHRACERIEEHSEIVGASKVYETAPMYDLEQPSFLNSAIWIRTKLAPSPLMRLLLTLESELGRVRDERRFGPRTIDLDLIAGPTPITDGSLLTLPHPRMLERPFVVIPMRELWPAWVHPESGRPLSELSFAAEGMRRVANSPLRSTEVCA